VVALIKNSVLIIIIISFLITPISVFAETNENTISAILTAKVATTSDENGKPIRNARIIVINARGEIIGTDLTNSEGTTKIPVTVQKDPKFPMKNMGEVTVIAVSNGFNEHINFSVPINEYNDHTARVYIPLRKIDPNRRNEPQFLHGNFHRFTVFKMLDYYAEKIGLKRQEISVDIGKEPPWSEEIIKIK
jgi:hypothetical protein